MTSPPHARVSGATLALTSLALVGFAANSVLCRLALRETALAPATFTAVRMAAGAVALWAIARLAAPLLPAGASRGGGSWISALALFAYAAAFSFAYVSLSTAAGALLLFGAVQLTMLARGWRAGERLRPIQVAGVISAIAGVAILLLPGWVAPSLAGGALMISAGVAWGVYSIRGRGSARPLADTAGNFARAMPLAAVLLALSLAASPIALDPRGIGLAIASGALASGIGYAIWYAALPGLPTTVAATVQLAVPLLATVGGAIVVDEPVTARLVLPGAAILGGLALVLFIRTPGRRTDAP